MVFIPFAMAKRFYPSFPLFTKQKDRRGTAVAKPSLRARAVRAKQSHGRICLEIASQSTLAMTRKGLCETASVYRSAAPFLVETRRWVVSVAGLSLRHKF